MFLCVDALTKKSMLYDFYIIFILKYIHDAKPEKINKKSNEFVKNHKNVLLVKPMVTLAESKAFEAIILAAIAPSRKNPSK